MITKHKAILMETSQELIDRIVDGEMSPDELRKALEQLNAAPDLWRQCALSFLEAQAWREALRPMAKDVTLDQSPSEETFAGRSDWTLEAGPVIRVAAPPRRRIRSILAAGIGLVAFSLGWIGHELRSRIEAPNTALIPLQIGSPALREQAKGDLTPTPFSEPLRPGSLAGLPTDRLPTVREVARLRIGTGGETPAEVPILAGPGISERWLLEQPAPVSEHDRAVWQRQGYQLQQQRRFVSVLLEDGRRAAVPIDHVQVRYVGRDPL
jgi:hypothetical protein